MTQAMLRDLDLKNGDLVRHCKTGTQIRIFKDEFGIWRDCKTKNLLVITEFFELVGEEMKKQPEICKSGPTYYIVKEDGEVHLPNTVNIDGKRVINVINKDFENTMTKKVGTLKEIGAKVGDTIRATVNDDVHWPGTKVVDELSLLHFKGDKYTIVKRVNEPTETHRWEFSKENGFQRAEDGPVREVTTVTKEIVSGWYGELEVTNHGYGIIGFFVNGCLDRDELDTLITNLQAIREAM